MLTKLDLVTLDELGYLPFSSSGGARLFHLLSKLNQRNGVFITTKLSFSELAQVVRDAKMATGLLDRLTHRCTRYWARTNGAQLHVPPNPQRPLPLKGQRCGCKETRASLRMGQISVRIPGQFSVTINIMCLRTASPASRLYAA
jgi:hypothetical protein